MKTKLLWVGALVLLLVVAMAWLVARSGSPDALPAEAGLSSMTQSGQEAASAVKPQQEAAVTAQQFQHYAELGAKLGAVPSSLAGTHVDGHVQADSAGRLIMAVGIKQMFDYYLSAFGEESLDNIKGRIAFYLKQHLPASAANEGWALFDRYMEYRQALSTLPAAGDSAASLQQALTARAQLRSSWLGEAASQAFFGPEEAYDNYTISRMQVEQDKSLSAAAKQQRLDQLKASLPPAVSDMIKATMAPTDAAIKVAAMRQQGASEADIQAYRVSQFGAEAAARFKALDAQRAAWNTRYDDYRQQRQAIVTAGLDTDDQTQQITALRERLFEAGEQKRVAALDDIKNNIKSTAKSAQKTEEDKP